MGIFSRKSTWQRLVEGALGATSRAGVRRAAKVTLGLVGGAVTATAMSAAASAARHQEQK